MSWTGCGSGAKGTPFFETVFPSGGESTRETLANCASRYAVLVMFSATRFTPQRRVAAARAGAGSRQLQSRTPALAKRAKASRCPLETADMAESSILVRIGVGNLRAAPAGF